MRAGIAPETAPKPMSGHAAVAAVTAGTAARRRRQFAVLIAAAGALAIAVTLSIAIGPVRIGYLDVWRAIFGSIDGLPRTIVWNLRLPRTLIGGMVGMGLALSGALLQGVMRNPLADPHIIGVSAGAGLGAVAVMTLAPVAVSHYISLAAFAGALISAAVVYGMAWKGGVAPMRLVLSGVAVSSLLSAGTSALLVLNSDNVQGAMTWLIGGLNGRGWTYWPRLWPYITVGSVVSFLASGQINLLLLGDEMAAGLGVRVERIRLLLVALAAMMAAASVSVAGLVGFIGLIVPHTVRLLVGSDYRFLLPTSALVGSALLILADTLARTVADPIELPVGILTAAMGAPFFIYLLRRGRTR